VVSADVGANDRLKLTLVILPAEILSRNSFALRFSIAVNHPSFRLVLFTMFQKPIIKLLVIVCCRPGIVAGVGINR